MVGDCFSCFFYSITATATVANCYCTVAIVGAVAVVPVVVAAGAVVGAA